MVIQAIASRGTHVSAEVHSKQNPKQHQSLAESQTLTFHDRWKPDGSPNHNYSGYTSRGRTDGKR
jgi:hypothetical protein